MRERKLFSRRDLFLFGALLLLCALLFWGLSRSPAGTAAVVERDGETFLRRELSQLDGPEEVTVLGADGLSVVIRLSPSGAEVASADCPDQICVRTGKLTQAGESAICLPARVSLRLEGSSGPDAETY